MVIFFGYNSVFGKLLNLISEFFCSWAIFRCCKWPNIEEIAQSSGHTESHVNAKIKVGNILQRTLNIGGGIAVQLISCFDCLDSVVSVHTNTNIFSCLVRSNQVEQNTSHILLLTNCLLAHATIATNTSCLPYSIHGKLDHIRLK